MPKYAIFFRLTGSTIAAAADHPSDRSAVVGGLCEAAGGRLESYYWMFGDYDGFAVADLPDSRAAAAVSLTATSTGAFAQLVTHELIPAGEINDRLAESKRLREAYTPPGG